MEGGGGGGWKRVEDAEGGGGSEMLQIKKKKQNSDRSTFKTNKQCFFFSFKYVGGGWGVSSKEGSS